MGLYRTSGNVVAAGTAPFLNIQGAANRLTKVRRIILSGFNLTAVQYLRITLSEYSTAPTGGTSTTPTIVAIDSPDAATAVVRQYTVAPTAGTLIGDIGERLVLGQATTAAAAGIPAIVEFSSVIELDGTANNLSARFGAAPATAVTLSYEIEFEQ